ncbi:MAG: hypothetical protein JOZ25_00730 [Actinobacteria bacterium]|nr:hypothetical protein [Actinomycetota bacterium]
MKASHPARLMVTVGAKPRAQPERREAPRRVRARARVELAIAAALLGLGLLVLRPGMALLGVAALPIVTLRLAGVAVGGMRRRSQVGLPPRRGRRAGVARARRAADVVTAAAVMAIVLSLASYGGALGSRSNSSLGIRSVEWLRDNGAAWLVSDVERLYYSITAPAKGGPALRQLPTVGLTSPRLVPTYRLPHSAAPPKGIAPVIAPALPGEGAWRATQDRFSSLGEAPLLVTTYRPDPTYPRVVAGVARINPRRAVVALYPGIRVPPGGASMQSAGEVPPPLRRRLLATFNGGFNPADYAGGFYTGGRLLEAMRPGLATLVGTTSGRVDVRTWHGGSRPGRNIVFARQNLPLIVADGRPNPGLSGGREWGTTVGNTTLVWRSGVGVDRHGNLLYAAASYRTVQGLADILVHAGAIRAMELDINSYWVTFNVFGQRGARSPSKLLGGMDRPATRYLAPDDRDFFAVYAR